MRTQGHQESGYSSRNLQNPLLPVRQYRGLFAGRILLFLFLILEQD
jgi:hypothetical protein